MLVRTFVFGSYSDLLWLTLTVAKLLFGGDVPQNL